MINSISNVCKQIASKSTHLDEAFVIELCPRIWALAIEHKQITVEDREKCFLETLLKGSFSLLAIKSPAVAIKISACNLQVFF